MNWEALRRKPAEEALKEIWLRADDELEKAFSNSFYWTNRWFDSEGNDRAEIVQLLLRSADLVDHAYEQWDLAFSAYQHAKEMP